MIALSNAQRTKMLNERRRFDEHLLATNGDRLPRDTWVEFAGDIKMVQRARMGVANYIMERCGIAVGINKKEFTYERSDDLGEAVESMKAQTPASDDHLEIDSRSIPIATFQKRFGWDARDNDSIEDGQNGNLGRNTRVAAMDQVAIKVEKLFITGGDSKVNGRQVRGVETNTAVSAPAATQSFGTLGESATADSWQKTVAKVYDLLSDNNADLTQVSLFVNSADWAAAVTKPYSDYTFNSLAEFVSRIQGVVGVVPSSYLARNQVVGAVVNPTTMVAPIAWQMGVRPIARLDQDDDYQFKAYAALGFDIFEDSAGNSSVARVVTQ